MFSPGCDNRGDERRPVDLTALLRTFYFNPRRHPDFGWAFLGRFLLYLGYFGINGYLLKCADRKRRGDIAEGRMRPAVRWGRLRVPASTGR
ncbi:hypothetical protein [Actinoplanes sp. DH11]|uniref:hypothetical protein n=1 Tax=Actinoplanes sp. DH11 TaxID=2857011 RepID=UPI001E2921CC|nr:hypothetical protein [Actinoplanes sp. DH11]